MKLPTPKFKVLLSNLHNLLSEGFVHWIHGIQTDNFMLDHETIQIILSCQTVASIDKWKLYFVHGNTNTLMYILIINKGINNDEDGGARHTPFVAIPMYIKLSSE